MWRDRHFSKGGVLRVLHGTEDRAQNSDASCIPRLFPLCGVLWEHTSALPITVAVHPRVHL